MIPAGRPAKSSSPFAQGILANDPRYGMGQALLAQGASTAPVQSSLEGLARALTGVVGGYQMKQAQQSAQARSDARDQTLANALMNLTGDAPLPEGVQGPVRPGGDVAGFARALMGNPDTAEMGVQVGLQDAMDRRKTVAEAAKARRDLQNELLKNGLVLNEDGSFGQAPKFAESKGAIEGTIAGARKSGEIGAEARNAGAIAQVEGMKAGARAAAEAPYKVQEVGPGGTLVAPFAQRGANGGIVYQSPNPAPGTGEGRFQASLGEGVAKDLLASRETAASAANTIRTLQTVKPLLANVIAGPLANERLAVAKVFAPLTGSEDVAATEAFVAQMGRTVLDLVKGLGTGSGISNADREYAERVAGGNITLNRDSIAKIIDITERASAATLTRYNERIAPVLSDQNLDPVLKSQLSVNVPQAQQPVQPQGGETEFDWVPGKGLVPRAR
jgi:hypothetical protein